MPFVKAWQLTSVTSKVKTMEYFSIFTSANAVEQIWIEEKSAPFLLFSFSQQTGIILGLVLLSGWLFGILGKLLVFKRISLQPLLSYPVNLLILVDEVQVAVVKPAFIGRFYHLQITRFTGCGDTLSLICHFWVHHSCCRTTRGDFTPFKKRYCS